MFCPNCNGFITEGSLIKSKVKKWENADIEYDARCPLCSEKIGVMFWGKLTLTEELQHKMEERARVQQISFGQRPSENDKHQKQQEHYLEPPSGGKEDPYLYPPLSGNEESPFDDDQNFLSLNYEDEEQHDYKQLNTNMNPVESLYTPDQLSGHYCPHCGQDLPNDIDLLPRRYRPRI